MITSIPWLKIAPKFGGHARKQASQLMHSVISIYIGGFGHLLFRSRFSIRASLAGLVPDATYTILRATSLPIRYGRTTIDDQSAITQRTTVAFGANIVPAGGSVA